MTGNVSDMFRLSALTIGAAAGAGLAIVHGVGIVHLAGVAVVLVLILLSFRRSEIGLLAALPVIYIIHPTPPRPGIAETLLAAMLGVAAIRAMFENRTVLVSELRGGLGALLFSVIALLSVNFIIALDRQTPITDWLRGAAPFAFLAMTLPYYLALRRQPKLAAGLIAASCVAAFLFAGHVIGVYLAEEAWKPNWYVLEGGEWVRIAESEARLHDGKTVEQFAMRVTLLLQQATDALVPMGIVLGIAGFAVGPRLARLPALFLATVGTIAVVVTYTRSMLIAAVVAAITLLMVAARIDKAALHRAVLALASCTLTAAIVIVGFDLGAIYKNRATQLYDATIGHSVDKQGRLAQGRLADENVTGRLEEYKIAWGKFRSAPLLGNGLGTKHRIRYAVGFGETIEAHVGYVHNWPLYMLMVSGVIGCVAYAIVLLGPPVVAMRRARQVDRYSVFVAGTVALLAVYGLFFAVFRLVSFNLLLAVIWAIALRPALEEAGEVR